MCSFKPGDEVVCVSAAPLYAGNEPSPFLVEGNIYVVSALTAQPFWGDIGVLFEGLPPAFQQQGGRRRDAGYDPSRFRKVQRKTSSLSIESFLTIKPGQHEEPKRVTTPKPVKVPS